MQRLARKRTDVTTTGQPNRRGAIVPLLAVLIPVILILGAFAINLAWISLTNTQLQIAADAAARAAGREFAYTQDLNAARARARAVIQLNKAGGHTLTLTDSEIVFGESVQQTSGANAGSWTFTSKDVTQGNLGVGPGKVSVNSVRINVDELYAASDMPMPVPGLALPGGFHPQASATSTQSDRDIVLVLDRSGSMNDYSNDPASWYPAGPGEAYYGSRWRELAVAVGDFIAILHDSPQNEQLGVATFSSSATADHALSFQLSDTQGVVDGYTRVFTGGTTAIGDGILQGRQIMNDPGRARTFSTKTMIVMTDGIQNTGTPATVQARNANRIEGITVHTITFSGGADQAAMQNVAAEGGGLHYHANSEEELRAVFREIARTLPTILTQ